ncbi:MAG: GUN4 domain-containing protein [Coleofasciculus sp. Co-bin14]|nr:GUN4 domain-containing protein [Coleofasciculus sp. Co-bin14]
MVKVALLIGVSQYGAGFNQLPASARDVAAMQRVWQHPDMGNFDEVIPLTDPGPQEMGIAIEQLFGDRNRDDLLLLYFSGHGVKDESGSLYLATRVTRKNERGGLIRSTAMSARFVQEIMSYSRARRQAIILDCCFSGAFAEGLLAKDDGSVDIKSQLGAEGRVILTSSTSTQYSFAQEGSDLSVYTRFLVEGIETGAADLDEDEVISADELHEYASIKVQRASPAMKPEIYTVKEGYKIILAKVPIGDPKLRYRKEVERYVHHGQISPVGRRILNARWNSLGLSREDSAAIELEVLKPYREYKKKLHEYEQALREAIDHEYPLNDRTRYELQDLQKVLSLRDEDIAPIEMRVLAQRESAFAFLETSPPKLARVALDARLGKLTGDFDSEEGIDYTRLQELLAAGKWQRADRETEAVMLKVSGREEEGWLTEENMKTFPCQALRTIDSLWVKYSNGQFGFSIQKHIWQDIENSIQNDHVDIWKYFGDKVGWRVNDSWIGYSNLTFSLDAPEGHLPGWVFVSGFVAGGFFGGGLFDRVEACEE